MNLINRIIKNLDYKIINDGFRVLSNEGDTCVISTGGIINNVISAKEFTNKKFAICDLFRTKPISKEFVKYISNFKNLITVDEQSTGGLSTTILELLNENKVLKHVTCLKLPEKYFFENGGRDHLLDISNLSPKKIANTIDTI